MPPMLPWQPSGWAPPSRVELPTRHHLRLVRVEDLDLLLAATGDTRDDGRRSRSGGRQGWPSPGLSVEDLHDELVRCVDAARAGTAYRYVLLPAGEAELLGVVAIETADPGHLTWWVDDLHVGGPVEAALGAVVEGWSGHTRFDDRPGPQSPALPR